MYLRFYIWSSVVALALALSFAPVLAGNHIDYPDHVKDEIEAANLEREARLVKLQQELEELRGSKLDVQIQKFKEVLSLLQTDREIRDLLKDHPEMYPLYKSALGKDAVVGPPGTAGFTGSGTDFCACLQHVKVRWLGQKEQRGEAVLALGDVLYDMRPGSKLGGTLCVMRDANERHAMLECRDPVRNEVLKRSIAMQRFHHAKDGKTEQRTASP